ncbi:thymidine kinase, cytosolic-like isoform X2 [Oratosquilla oratoria]|uniref:thymidine kinase, cytosolic-like isoform X2 n=1 Tax=Oratosquilla oratoria TaxID=337810 RepID=UPI003F758107
MSCIHMSWAPISNENHHGQIQIIFGPMFSGKTTELMRRLKRYQIAKHNCLIIKYAKDVRFDLEGIATHDSQVLSAIPTTELKKLKEKAMQCSVIGIDEGQFFPDTVEFAEEMANKGKIIVVAALDGTYMRTGFTNMLSLVPLAESVVKLTAVCVICYEPASFTKRTTSETAVEVIGGSDKYIAVCRRCHKMGVPFKEIQANEERCTKKLTNGVSTEKREAGDVEAKENVQVKENVQMKPGIKVN